MFATILGIIRAAQSVGPDFAALVNGIKPLFSGAQQGELQTALQEAMERSNAAQNDFVKASRGE